MNKNHEKFIEIELRSCVLNTINRLEAEDTYRPFHSALLSEQALFWSRFERSFSTSFGQRVIEKISKAAVESGGATLSENQKAITFHLSTLQLNAIEDHISNLRNGKNLRPANWLVDVERLSSISSPSEPHLVRVISDLWWEKDGVNNYMSIKTVKPNIDQTAEAKRDLLKIKLSDPSANVYFGLYYNPYGEEKSDYNWSPPKRIFNFNSDSCILIGKEYWNTLGGDGFYEELLNIAGRVGQETKKLIEKLR